MKTVRKVNDKSKTMLPIVYEDDDVVAIDKPAGIASIPERDLSKDTVVGLLEKQLKQKLFVVHRLDKEVSGCMLFAKNAETHKLLNEQFFSRNVHKTYIAIVHGKVLHDQGTIDKPVRQFGSGRMGVDESKGKKSVTEYTVVKRFGGHTLIEARPITGKRHQIRVHLYSIGHPVAGDMMYGDKAVQKKYPRLMLHSKSIQFTTTGGKAIVVESRETEAVFRGVNIL
jgi:tRNA pseudouridine32 synthase / 23S rRNA pseudouridine746 synthase